MAVFVAVVSFVMACARAQITNETQGGASYATIAAAVSAANPGDSLLVLPGTYYVTNVAMNKVSLTLRGASTNDSIVICPNVASGIGFTVSATNTTIRDLQLRVPRPDNSEVIRVNRGGGSYVKIRNNLILGQYVQGIGAVSVGISIGYGTSGGVTNLLVDGNVLHSLRQPGRLDGAKVNYLTGLPVANFYECSGVIASNHVYNTKGWTIWGDGPVNWVGNTFGTGGTNHWGTNLGSGDQANWGDITIVGSTPSWAASNYLNNIVAMSQANNDCVVEDQRSVAAEGKKLSVVHVDPASLGGNGVSYDPYATITQAVARAANGGIVTALSGAYSANFTLNKNLTFDLTTSAPVTNFTITPAPPEGYRFYWSGAIGGCPRNGNVLTVIMDSDRVFSGNIVRIIHGAIVTVK